MREMLVLYCYKILNVHSGTTALHQHLHTEDGSVNLTDVEVLRIDSGCKSEDGFLRRRCNVLGNTGQTLPHLADIDTHCFEHLHGVSRSDIGIFRGSFYGSAEILPELRVIQVVSSHTIYEVKDRLQGGLHNPGNDRLRHHIVNHFAELCSNRISSIAECLVSLKPCVREVTGCGSEIRAEHPL